MTATKQPEPDPSFAKMLWYILSGAHVGIIPKCEAMQLNFGQVPPHPAFTGACGCALHQYASTVQSTTHWH